MLNWERRLQTFGRWVDNHGAPNLHTFSTVGLAASAAFLPTKWIAPALAFFLFFGSIYFWSSRILNYQIRQISHLRAKVAQLKSIIQNLEGDYFEHCSSQLQLMGDRIDLRGSDRLSLYKYENEQFIMIGRYAQRPEFRATGRGIYPADIGIIGHAWRSPHGFAHVHDLPDPAFDLDAYCSENQERFGMPLEITRDLVMKSRTISAHVLHHRMLQDRRAVIVIESLEPDRFSQEELAAVVGGPTGRQLALVLEVFRGREPSPGVALEKGF